MPNLKTNQEIFDYVARHLILQGRKSMDPTGRFPRMYAEDGAKSALGVLIEPKHYVKELHDPDTQEGPLADAVFGAIEKSGVRVTRSSQWLLEELHVVTSYDVYGYKLYSYLPRVAWIWGLKSGIVRRTYKQLRKERKLAKKREKRHAKAK